MNKNNILVTKLIIAKENQYLIKNENVKFFQFKKKGMIYRDIYCDIKKNNLEILKKLASITCISGYSKMKKEKLVNELNNILVFE